ncbi:MULTISPECIES: acetyltransferase [Paenibacillus]|jgi:putative acetyltransferase|uniref:acetyltransferase n=1 Tax=Paenibacillus TaxID=44249 RepID=UPI000BA50C99|nr:acetyltransferase [Paenibacillus sp. 7523-1]MBM6385293.1 acetyltransferase [Paenibacillus sp.]PAD29253.1 acetyltransferase [Paenibacillus sp. 7523-1]
MMVTSYRALDHAKLVAIWERAVRATHTFLAEEDIVFYKSVVSEALSGMEVWEAVDSAGEPVGFMGLDGKNMEMLFVDADQHGKGVGRMLVMHAIDLKGNDLKVDVNEQNEGAAQFYNRMGFVQTGRSELDGSGNPFPILHLELK